jgi:hypothetical protein
MRLLSRLWPALEELPGLAACLGTWREHIGDDLDAIAGLLRPTDRCAVRLPCPSPGSDGCPRRVLEHADGTVVAVCGDRPQRCDPVEVCRAELIVHALDPRRLCAAVASVLQLDDMFQVVDACWQTWRVGDYVPLSGERFPVYLSIPDSPDRVHAAAVRLTGIADRPFLMLVPARAQVDPATSELLSRTKSRILPLDDVVAIDAEARWIGQRPPAQLLREFRLGIFGEDGPAVPAIRFPTPPGARWEEVSIRFITQHQVHVRVRDEAGPYEHTQMGMANSRNDQPTKQWELLQLFAESRGELTWESAGADRRNEHRRQLLARQLRAFFGIEGDPFDRLPRGRGWRTRFTIIPEP